MPLPQAHILRFDDLVGRNSRLTLGLAQPLRVGSGTGTVALPSQVMIYGPGQYEYVTSPTRFDLSPLGREIDLTAEMAKRLSNGLRFNVSAMAMHDPGHDSDAPIGFAGLAGLQFAF